MASIEQQLYDLIDRATLDDPIVFGLAHGTLSDIDLPEGMTPDEFRAKMVQTMISTLGAYRECIMHLARAVDELRAAQHPHD